MTTFNFSAPQTYICELNQYSSALLLKGELDKREACSTYKNTEKESKIAVSKDILLITAAFDYLVCIFCFRGLYLLVFVLPLTKIPNLLRNINY